MSRSVTGGNRHQGSKWITPKRRMAIYLRDRYVCLWCGCVVATGAEIREGSTLSLATLDHFLGRLAKGNHATSNLFTACMACNAERGDMSALGYATLIAERRAESHRGSVDVSTYRHETLCRIITQLDAPVEGQFRL